MLKKLLLGLGAFLVLIILYMTLWPVPMEPVLYTAPPITKYEGPYAANDHLATGLEKLDIGDNHGPEDVVIDKDGYIFTGTEEGRIVRLNPDGTGPVNWADTKGRPLGLALDGQGRLVVADAYRGLLRIAKRDSVEVLTDKFQGKPIVYADDLDIAADGKIYFSDASTLYGAEKFGGVTPSSRIAILNHGKDGRLLVYDPATKQTSLVMDGLTFSNGVALAKDDSFVLVNETGLYRVHRFWLKGPKKGTSEIFISGLPGFPDNIERGPDGLFWVAVIAPRSPALDGLAGSKFMRKLAYRLPEFLQPQAVPYLHIVGIDANGKVKHSLQDPKGAYTSNTSVWVGKEYFYLGSLHEKKLARVKRSASAK